MPIDEERQVDYQYNSITETRHYPHDIDEILTRGVHLIDSTIRQLMSVNEIHTYVEDKVDNPLVKRIVYEIYITTTNRGLLGEYHSNGFDGHKIDTALIVLHVCVNHKGEYSVDEIKTMLSHELTHLLEDNKRQINKGQSLYGHPKNETLYDLFNNPDVPSELGNLIYLNSIFEKKAFAAQVYYDIDAIECNANNYRQKATNVAVHKQYTKAFSSFCNFLNDDIHVETLNRLILSLPTLRQLHVPHQPLDDFNIDACRARLKKWAQKQYSNFQRRFWSTVTYYVENHT